jgi:vancomycin resistance protein VanJ
VLLAIVVLFRVVGERWWPLAPLLYLPRIVLGLPLLLLVPLVWRAHARRLWIPVVASVPLLLFPLLGLTVSLPHRGGAPALQVMSYNIWFGRRGAPAIFRELDAARPDVVAVQAFSPELGPAFRAHLPGWYFDEDGDFFLASRFPIRDSLRPPPLGDSDGTPAAFRRYTLETPLGPLDLFNSHPYSVRDGIDGLRERDAQLSQRLSDNVTIRRLQVAALAAEARRSSRPVIVVGDFNLPGLSQILGEHLGTYRDGFASAGMGFGYTFPTNQMPWLRLDRILVGDGLRVRGFSVGGGGGSDHRPVVAEIEAERR